MTSSNNRESQYPIDKIFLDRWSPRAYSNETMPEKDLLTILKAAHWAPSASNLQQGSAAARRLLELARGIVEQGIERGAIEEPSLPRDPDHPLGIGDVHQWIRVDEE